MSVDWRIIVGDCREFLRALPERSVQTCITSPPYFGLRDYGTGEWEGGEAGCDHVERASARNDLGAEDLARRAATYATGTGAGSKVTAVQFRDLCGKCGARRVDQQIGLEPTPDEFVAALVAVFREVRRVLRDDGTVWLNLGDSYCSTDKWGGGKSGNTGKHTTNGEDVPSWAVRSRSAPMAGIKPKDLIGIPWMVAQALRAPYYTGTIKDERDRIWLAAMIDAEGCLFIHKRKVGQSNGQGYERKNDSYGSGMEISNTSRAIVDRVMTIVGRGSISTSTRGRNQPLYRWNLRTNECRDVLREVYPHLVAKQHQARLALGCPTSGPNAEAAHASLMALHNGAGATIDFPPPESMFEPGWYLRSDIVWSKLNPMPESVTDRPTKAHEYLFLLSKGPRYFYDADAVREDAKDWSTGGPGTGIENTAERYGAGNGGNGGLADLAARYKGSRAESDYMAPTGARHDAVAHGGRNKRSVWTVATQPYAGAHFATFPPKLIEPCILAGSPPKCCGECGASWRRVVERTPMVVRPTEKRANWQAEDDHARTQTGGTMLEPPSSRTTGWEPTCTHRDDTGRSIVLDPFAGAGTVGVVCGWHGREFIGCELNPEYAAMARERIALEGRPGGKPNGHEVAAQIDGQLGLLGDAA